MPRIFVSHSSQDDFAAVAVRDWLGEQGWNDVFLDFDSAGGIRPGERWERSLYNNASRCEAVVFLISRSWLGSEWCRSEYELARKLNKRLFVVLIEALPIEELPSYLRQTHQAVSLALGEDHRVFRAVRPVTHEERHVTFSREGLARLKAGLTKAGLDPRFFQWPPENEPDRAPYRGLEALDAVDAGIFFGREGLIIEALDALRGMHAMPPPRLFVILGASGAGKSSFLRAGLMPRLRRDDQNFLCLPVVRPEHASVSGSTGLVSALIAACAENGVEISRAQVREATRQGVSGLGPLLTGLVTNAQRSTASPHRPILLLAIDQAEELFVAEGAQEGRALLALLRDLAIADNPAVLVVFAIRTDSYDLLERTEELQGLSQRPFSLLPLPPGAYQTVIEGPAKRLEEAGRPFELDPALTQALLEDVAKSAGGDSLPLLALTMEQLYHDHFNGRRLSREDYEHFGRLTAAIEAAMERVFAAADVDPRIPKDRDARLALLRRGLIPWLAGIDPDTKTVRRRVARTAQIPPEALPLIDLLVAQRLLTRDVDKSTGESTIEPAHEALLRQWGLLHGWLEEDFGLLTVLEGVKRAARDWDANAKAASWLGHQGERLVEARALYSRPDISARLDPIDHAYLVNCGNKERAAQKKARTVQAAIYTLLLGIIVGLLGWINQAYLKEKANWLIVMRPYMMRDVRPYVLSAENERALKPGDYFQECAKTCPDCTKKCPEMVVLPSGSFYMGAPTSEKGVDDNRGPPSDVTEGPQHWVTINRVFAVAKTNVTFDQWDECTSVGGCPHVDDSGMGRGKRPVINISWNDAKHYAAWFSIMTGKSYRLLTEAEWEYAARAGSTTAYYWGPLMLAGKANCNGCGDWTEKKTSPVDQFPPNKWGLYDMAGNVWQWVEDCYHSSYDGAPTDGSAWADGNCNRRVNRGGSWSYRSQYARSASRDWNAKVDKHSGMGFRVARNLER